MGLIFPAYFCACEMCSTFRLAVEHVCTRCWLVRLVPLPRGLLVFEVRLIFQLTESTPHEGSFGRQHGRLNWCGRSRSWGGNYGWTSPRSSDWDTADDSPSASDRAWERRNRSSNNGRSYRGVKTRHRWRSVYFYDAFRQTEKKQRNKD